MKATWNGQVIAESADTVVVEGNHYFPDASIRSDFFSASDHTSSCPWKGVASYSDLVVGGERNANAAWRYLEPLEAAKEIKGLVAFWRGVEISA